MAAPFLFLSPTSIESIASGTHLKLDAIGTGGAYALREGSTPPGRRIPMHVHSREDEAWYVLNGQLSFDFSGEKFVATPGSVVFSPRGTPHSFANLGTDLARFLEIFSPPGLEYYFEERAELARRGEPGRDYAGLTSEQHEQLAAKYRLTFLDD